MRFTIFQDSRQGGRNNNEDRTSYSYSHDALLMVIADGMGGHHYGEIASQIAVQMLVEQFRRHAKPFLDDPFRFLQKSIIAAHQAINSYATNHNLGESPCTTLVAAVIQNNIAYWAHAGDSRLYMLRRGQIVAQTRDHSRIRMLLEEGMVTEAQAAAHPDRNKIYSCLGGREAPEIDYSHKIPLQQGDIILLATDGLWGAVTPHQICNALNHANLTQSLPLLMDLAEKQAGIHGDNLSAVAVCWDDNYDLSNASISTQTMTNGEVSTCLSEFGRQTGAKQELSDDEIEAAIEEIRNAIEKYNPRR